jgi:hypothetical protein
VLRVQVVFFLGEALSPGRRGGGIPWVLFFMCSVSAAQPCPRFLVGKPHHIVVAVQGPPFLWDSLAVRPPDSIGALRPINTRVAFVPLLQVFPLSIVISLRYTSIYYRRLVATHSAHW